VAAAENPSPPIPWAPGFVLCRLAVHLAVLAAVIAGVRATATDPFADRLLLRLALVDLAALEVIPAGATYHFVLLIFPLAAIVSRLRDAPLLVAALVGLHAAIGFVPYRFFPSPQTEVILAFPRLWLMTALFAVAVAALVAAPRPSGGSRSPP
jgi:hypothetical protein